MNRVVVATSLVRSHVVFKFLNYVTDKIIRVVSNTLALMIKCVQTMCVQKHGQDSLDLILLFTVFICLSSVAVGFGYFSFVRPLK